MIYIKEQNTKVLYILVQNTTMLYIKVLYTTMLYIIGQYTTIRMEVALTLRGWRRGGGEQLVRNLCK